MRLAIVSLAALLTAGSTAARASVVFTDGFNVGPNAITSTQLTHQGATGNFITAGNTNVDLLYKNGNFGSYCAAGLSCVDLGGTGGSSPLGFIMTPTNTFTGHEYYLSFSATATPGYPNSTLFVQFGNYSYTFDLATLPGNAINVQNVHVFTNPGDALTFGYVFSGGNENAGPILSTVEVQSTPEPSSLALLGTGLLSSVGVMARRRRKA